MLGEQIAELKGKVMGQRVLNAQEPTLETSVSARGSVKGIQVTETLTYVARLTPSGMLHGEGHGILMAGESDLARYSGEGFGRLTSSGTIWHGAIFYRTSSTGKLAPLNNVVGVVEGKVDNEGNFSENTWGMEVGSSLSFSD